MPLAADLAAAPWRAGESASDSRVSMTGEGARPRGDQASRLGCARCQSIRQSFRLGSVIGKKNRGEISGAHERRRKERPGIRCAPRRGCSRIDPCDIGRERRLARVDEHFEAGSSERVHCGLDAEPCPSRSFAVDVAHNKAGLCEPPLHATERPLAGARTPRCARRARSPGCRHRWACNGRGCWRGGGRIRGLGRGSRACREGR